MKVGEELLDVFCLVDDKGVIHMPKPDPGGLGELWMVLPSKSLDEQVSYWRAYGRSMVAPCTCS